MKKIIKLLGIAAVAGMTLVSCVHKGDLNLDPVPDIAFNVEFSGLDAKFTSAVEGTTGITWEINDGAKGEGETFEHTFAKPGTYWVIMTGTYNGTEQTTAGKIRVDKPSRIKLDDNTFDDWNYVRENYDDFLYTGPAGGFIEGMLDYDANYIYVYYEADLNSATFDTPEIIVDFFIDVDGDSTTGYTDGGLEGAEYLLEGSFFGDDAWWGVSAPNWSDLPDSGLADKLSEAFVIGHNEVDEENGRARVEFAISRDKYEINTAKFGFKLVLLNNDWGDVDALADSEGNDYIIAKLDKES